MSKDVPKLYHCDHLCNESTAHFVNNLLEERLEMVQIIAEVYHRLEAGPDRMVSAGFYRWPKLHLLLQPSVKLLRILPVLAQIIHLHISVLYSARMRDEELIFALREVHAAFVSEVEQEG